MRDWSCFGNKSNIKAALEEVTGVPSHVLENGIDSSMSIAARMSWASKRETTRTEDMAYCLMGLFDINMPLLYGEGDKAFFRLQEEILRT